MEERSIRAAQLISPFGPGAVIDLGSESFTCMDISTWPASECPVLEDNALQRALGQVIRRPPIGDQLGQIPFSRFPRWMFCPSCRRLFNYSQADDARAEFQIPECFDGDCGHATLVPMRFVVACSQGHLQDVDWFRWAHKNIQLPDTGQCGRQTAELYFDTTGASGGDFNAMSVRCGSCNAFNTFEGLTNRPYPFGCHGRQPWQAYREAGSCNEAARVFPRAASNVYYAQTRSALDIGSDGAVGGSDSLAALKAWLATHPRVVGLRPVIQMLPIWRETPALFSDIVRDGVNEFGLSEIDVRGAVIDSLDPASNVTMEVTQDRDNSQHGFLRSEWPYLARKTGIQGKHLRTTAHDLAGLWPPEYAKPFEQITLVERLREVRVLLGFKRVKPDIDGAEVPVDLGAGMDWLPGVETFGEGIFLKLSEPFVAAWEAMVVPETMAQMTRLAQACSRWGREPTGVYASPRFIALHTLAHGLVRRLAFDAGYSSSSIRERVYCDHGVHAAAGILLYTSDGDSEGSLGGLVRQGLPDRFIGTLQRTLADLSWCSADPVCSEMDAQGVDGMNAAACHACALISETSCTFNNSLLDRRLIVGGANKRVPGLLEALAMKAV